MMTIIEQKFREHYREKFNADALAKARQKAPDLQGENGEHIVKRKAELPKCKKTQR